MSSRYNQNAKTKPCPRCGVGTIYTQAEMRQYNQEVDGIQVCTNCKTQDLINQALNRRAQ